MSTGTLAVREFRDGTLSAGEAARGGGGGQPAPYKGPESFQAEDAALFFGRDPEARQLVARILSRRLTLLHAPSGAGKTSLLNARIIPELEKRGWMPVRILPTDDPLASIRTTTLQHLLPPLSIERRALRNAVSALCAPGEDPTLERLLELYDALSVRDPHKRNLISPLATRPEEASLVFPAGCRVVPYVSRLLRSSLSVRLFAEHFTALPAPGATLSDDPGIHPGMHVSALHALLASPVLASSCEALLGMLNLPGATLLDFFENIAEVYEPRQGFCLVLLLDQFEELFTRFGDRPGMPSFRRREETFRQLDEVYNATARDEQGETVSSRLPLRLVVSMRDEYLARVLDHVRMFAGITGEPGYHLYLLSKDEARAAIQEPALAYGYTYAPHTFDALISGLLREGSYVEPTALQIVCAKLWEAEGRVLAAHTEAFGTEPDARSGPAPSIAPATLIELDGVRGILASFFTDFVTHELDDARARFEAFEMLEQLVTGSHTRNIVEREQLVRQLFRDIRLRARVLDKLERGKILRVEQRLDGYFVEITHEFLIEPILAQIKLRLTSASRYRDSLRNLVHCGEVNFRTGTQVLSEEHFHALDEYWAQAAASGGDVVLSPWAVELMFRTAIVRNVDRETMRRWGDRFAELPEVALAQLLEGAEDSTRPLSFSLEELWYLRDHGGDLGRLTPRATEHLLVSALQKAGDLERAHLRTWTKAYMNC